MHVFLPYIYIEQISQFIIKGLNFAMEYNLKPFKLLCKAVFAYQVGLLLFLIIASSALINFLKHVHLCSTIRSKDVNNLKTNYPLKGVYKHNKVYMGFISVKKMKFHLFTLFFLIYMKYVTLQLCSFANIAPSILLYLLYAFSKIQSYVNFI